MDDNELWNLIQQQLGKAHVKGMEVRTLPDLHEKWRRIWSAMRRGIPQNQQAMALDAGFQMLLKRLHADLEERISDASTRPFQGRDRVPAGPDAIVQVGEIRLPLKHDLSSPPQGGRKRKRPQDEDEEQVVASPNWEPDLEDYMDPTGVFLAQPGRMSGRIPTLACGEARNQSKCPAPVAKDTGWQRIDKDRVQSWTLKTRRLYDSQHTVMGCSAAQAAHAAGLQKLLRDGIPWQWEWLHLCAFKMGGMNNAPQQPGNLVAGTYDCNTAMISLEDALKALAMEDHLLDVRVQAHLYPGTHVAMQVDYTVRCGVTESVTRFYPMATDAVMRGETTAVLEALRQHFKLPKAKELPGAKRQKIS